MYFEISGHSAAILSTLKSHWLREFLGNPVVRTHSLGILGCANYYRMHEVQNIVFGCVSKSIENFLKEKIQTIQINSDKVYRLICLKIIFF